LKKAVIIVAAILFLGVSFGVFAAESELYARTILIEKVYPHKLGYKIMYITSKLDFTMTYIPHKWFSHSSAKEGSLVKGEVVWGNDSSYPYMIVFWKEGKFSHIRLFLKSNLHDISYGTLDPSQNVEDKFNIEEISLEF
jgi:hypothetical protein